MDWQPSTLEDSMVRVLLADDQAEVRSALRLLLEQEPEIVVAGEAEDLAGLLAAACRMPGGADVVLLDWELPGLGRQDVSIVQRAWPGARLVAMSGHPEAQSQSLSAGADGFVSKGDPPERLLAVLDACCRRPEDVGTRRDGDWCRP
jgi:DNA-binding NarL/FixJ family response regulator